MHAQAPLMNDGRRGGKACAVLLEVFVGAALNDGGDTLLRRIARNSVGSSLNGSLFSRIVGCMIAPPYCFMRKPFLTRYRETHGCSCGQAANRAHFSISDAAGVCSVY